MLPRHPIVYRVADAFFRHRNMFLVAMILVAGIATVVLLRHTKSFVAVAKTQIVTTDVASELGVAPSQSTDSPAQTAVDHFNDLITDDLPGGFLDSALTSANLEHPINVDPAKADPRLNELTKGLKVEADSDNLFTITLTWDNPEECERIVASLQRQYIDAVGEDRSEQANATTHFLDSQISDYEKRMRVAEQALIDYKQRNAGESPEEQSADVSQLTNLQAQLDTLKITERDSTLRKQGIEQRMSELKPIAVTSQVDDNPYVEQLKALKAKRESMITGGMLPTHPAIVALDSQIQELQGELPAKLRESGESSPKTSLVQDPEYQSLQEQLTDAQITEQTQQAEMQHLQQEISGYQVRVARIPQEQKDLTDRTRDYSILQEQYQSLLERREQMRIKGNLDRVSATSTLNPIGEIYAEPTVGRSKKILMVIGALLLGAIVGGLLIVACEWADPSLRYDTDAERLMGVPVLAMLPESQDLRFSVASSRGLPPGGDAPRLTGSAVEKTG